MIWGPGWSRNREREWVFTLTMGDAGQMQARLGAEVLNQVFEEFAEVLRKSVRPIDSVVGTSGGELVMRIRGVDETKCAAVQKRITERLADGALPLLRQLNLEIRAVEPDRDTQGGLLFCLVPIEEGRPGQQRSKVC